jgi:hypothetical protein
MSTWFRLIRADELQKGGHFAALECPEEMWEDVQNFLVAAEEGKAQSNSRL